MQYRSNLKSFELPRPIAGHLSLQSSQNGLLDLLRGLDKQQLNADPELRNGVISLLLSPRDERIRLSALEALASLFPADAVVAEATYMIVSEGQRSDIAAPASLRQAAIRLLARKVLYDPDIKEHSPDLQRSQLAMLAALEDPIFSVRTQAIHALSTRVEHPAVYQKLAKFLLFDPGFDQRLRVNFEVRLQAVRALRRAIQIPFVRDVFVAALEQPELNHEVRGPLINSLASLLEDSKYPLRQDDRAVMSCLLSRQDSTRSIQELVRGIQLKVMLGNENRFREAHMIAAQRAGATLEGLLEGQPLMQFLYKHGGHLLKQFEADPIVDTRHSWPMHIRRFLGESEFRKMWVDNSISLPVKNFLSTAISWQLSEALDAVSRGERLSPHPLGDILAFVAWSGERRFDSQVLDLQHLASDLPDTAACTEGFSIPELLEFIKQASDRAALERRRSQTSFELRVETRLLGEQVASAHDPKSVFLEALELYRQALELRVVSSESLLRMGRALMAYEQKDPLGFYQTLFEIGQNSPATAHLLGAAIDKCQSAGQQLYCERAWLMLSGTREDFVRIMKDVQREQADLKAFASKSELKNQLTHFANTFVERLRYVESNFGYFISGLQLYERALDEQVFGEQELKQLGKMLDQLLLLEPQKFFKGLREIGLNPLSARLKAALSIAAIEQSSLLTRYFTPETISSALGI